MCFRTHYIILNLISNWGKEQCLPNDRMKLRLGCEVHNIFHVMFILVRTFYLLIRILINPMDDC